MPYAGVSVEGVGNDLPKQGRKLDYMRDFGLELYRVSRDEHERRWVRDHFSFYSLYRNFSRTGIDPDDYHSSITLGLAFPLVKILSANLSAPWQAGDQIMDVQPTDTLSIEAAPKIAAVVNDYLTHKIPRAFSKIELVVESACALGRGVLKRMVRRTPPRTLLQRQNITLPLNIPGFPTGVPVGSYLGWTRTQPGAVLDIDYVDPFQFWYIGSSRYCDGCDQTFEVQYLTDAEVCNRIESGEFNVKFDFEPGAGLGYDNWYERRRSLSWGFGDQVRANSQGPRPHRYVEIQGKIETRRKEDGYPVYEDRILGILDEAHVVKSDRLMTYNAQPDYIVWELYQDIGGDRPMGIIEPSEQVLYAIDDYVSIALDNARKIVESSLAVDPSATEQTEIMLGAGAVNWIKNPSNSIRPLEMKDLPGSFFSMLTMLNEILYRVSGISDLVGGVSTNNLQQGADTARGMQMMLTQASSRSAPLRTKLDHEFYRPLAEWIHRTAALRMDGDHFVRVMNSQTPQFQAVTPEDMQANVDYAFNTRALDQALGTRRSDFIQLFTLLTNPVVSGLMAQQGVSLDMMESGRLLLSEFDRGQDVPGLLRQLQAARPGMLPAAPGGPGGPFATPGAPATAPGAPMPAGSSGPPATSPTGLPPLAPA